MTETSCKAFANIANLCVDVSREGLNYDPLGRMAHTKDQRYENLLARRLMVPGVAFIEKLQAERVSATGDLTLAACGGNLNIMAADEIDIISNTAIILDAPLIGIDTLSVSNLVPCDPNGTINIIGNVNVNLSIDLFPQSNATGANIVINPFDPHFVVASIKGVGNVSVTGPFANGDIVIDANVPPTTLTSLDSPPNVNIVADGTGPAMTLKSLSGTGTTIVTNNATTVNIFSASTDVLLTANLSNGGVNIVSDPFGPAVEVKGIIATGATSVTANATTVNIYTPNTTLTALANVNLVAQGQGPDLQLYGLDTQTPLRTSIAQTSATAVSVSHIYDFQSAVIESFDIPTDSWWFPGGAAQIPHVTGFSQSTHIGTSPTAWTNNIFASTLVNSSFGSDLFFQGMAEVFIRLVLIMDAATAAAMTGDEVFIIGLYNTGFILNQTNLGASATYRFAPAGSDAFIEAGGNARIFSICFSLCTPFTQFGIGFYHNIGSTIHIVGDGETHIAAFAAPAGAVPAYQAPGDARGGGVVFTSYYMIKTWNN